MGQFAVLILLCLAVLAPAFGDEIATTVDGKKVILYDNGTWKYITRRKAIEAKFDPSKIVPVQLEITGMVKAVYRDSTADVRKLRWGMKTSRVKELETADFIGFAKDTMRFWENVDGFDNKISYIFENDTLVEAICLVSRKTIDPADYNREYINLRLYLENLYGAMLYEHNNFTNQMYKDKPNMWGFAISLGFLERRAIWQRGNTKTVVVSSGGGHAIDTQISMRQIRPTDPPEQRAADTLPVPDSASVPAK